MKIGMVAQGLYPYNFGGHEIRINQVGKRLAKNHELHLYLPDRKNTNYPEEFEGIKIHPIQIFIDNPHLLTSLTAFEFAKKVSKKIENENLDIVDILFYSMPFEKRGKKVVVSTGAFYGSFENRNLSRKIITGPIVLLKILLNKVKLRMRDKVIALSEIAQEETLNHFGVEKDEIEVVSPGVSEDFNPNLDTENLRNELNIGRDEFVITFTGRLVREKGILDLFKALGMISDNNIRALIIGEGDLKNNLEKEANRLGVRCEFLGRIDHSELPNYLNISDLFVLPSHWEIQPYPLSALEAMACGVPSILTDVGIVGEEEKGSDYCLRVEPGKPEALAKTIIKLKQNDELREKLSKNGLKLAEERSWDKTVKKMEKIYKSIL